MIKTNETTVCRNVWAKTPPEITELIEQMSEERRNRLDEFRERMTDYEHRVDEMLIDFAGALALVKSISLPQFDPDWRMKLLELAQHLYRIPRQIFQKETPDEYEELSQMYLSFVIEADAMGEDTLEFLISIEKGDLEDASDLLGTLSEGLERLETMLTTRWRETARLFRKLEDASDSRR